MARKGGGRKKKEGGNRGRAFRATEKYEKSKVEEKKKK